LNGCAFFRLKSFSFPTCQYDTRIAGTLQSPARLHLSPSRLDHTPYRLIGDSIIVCNFSQRFTLVNAMKNDVPFSSGYFPMGIIRPWSALRKRRGIRQVSVRVSVDEEIISAWEQFLKRDEGKVRPVVRCPSVPVRLFMHLSSFNRTNVQPLQRLLPALALLYLPSNTRS
jgi:hypothetical protein